MKIAHCWIRGGTIVLLLGLAGCQARWHEPVSLESSIHDAAWLLPVPAINYQEEAFAEREARQRQMEEIWQRYPVREHGDTYDYQVEFHTDYGLIVLAMFSEVAPDHVRLFLTQCDLGLFTGQQLQYRDTPARLEMVWKNPTSRQDAVFSAFSEALTIPRGDQVGQPMGRAATVFNPALPDQTRPLYFTRGLRIPNPELGEFTTMMGEVISADGSVATFFDTPRRRPGVKPPVGRPGIKKEPVKEMKVGDTLTIEKVVIKPLGPRRRR